MTQFNKYSEDSDRIPEEPYDFWSIMHYGSYYLSSNGGPTMTDINGDVFITQVSKNMNNKIKFKKMQLSSIYIFSFKFLLLVVYQINFFMLIFFDLTS